MNKETRYSYQKRIKELEAEVRRLRLYRDLAIEVYDGVLEVWGDGKQISMGWILKKFKWLLK